MNKSTFRDDLSGYIRGHVAKSIAPFRITNYVMFKVICQQLFNRLVTSILIYRVAHPATNK